MIRGESNSDQKMASEADVDTVDLLCAARGRAGPAPVYEIANNILNAPALGARALAMVEALAVEA